MSVDTNPAVNSSANDVEESKEPVQRAMLSDKSLAEVEATLTEEERAKVTEMFNDEIGFTKVI